MGMNGRLVKILGAANILVDGTNIGHTTRDSVKITTTPKIVSGEVGKWGDAAVRAFHAGAKVLVEFMLHQTELDALELALPGVQRVSGAGIEKLTFGVVAGTPLPEVELELVSVIEENEEGFSAKFTRAVAIGEFSAVYTGDDTQKWACQFLALMDEDLGRQWAFGNQDATQDPVAAAVSAVDPTHEEIDVSIDANIIATITKELQGSTVNAGNVLLYLNDAQPVQVLGDVVLNNNGALTTVTFSPSEPLDNSKEYVFMITSQVRDVDGNTFTSFASTFMTEAP